MPVMPAHRILKSRSVLPLVCRIRCVTAAWPLPVHCLRSGMRYSLFQTVLSYPSHLLQARSSLHRSVIKNHVFCHKKDFLRSPYRRSLSFPASEGHRPSMQKMQCAVFASYLKPLSVPTFHAIPLK